MSRQQRADFLSSPAAVIIKNGPQTQPTQPTQPTQQTSPPNTPAPDIQADTVVINLDRRPDRMEYMLQHMPVDLQHNHRRYSAVDGGKLGECYETRPDLRPLLDTLRDKARVLGEVGCALSHYSVWKDASVSRPTLVLEDDVMFSDESGDRFKQTMRDIYQHRHRTDHWDWDVMYVGGQWTPHYGIEAPCHYEFQMVRHNTFDRFFTKVSHTDTLYRRANPGYSAAIHGSRNVWVTPIFRTAGAYLISPRGVGRLMEAVHKDRILFMNMPLDMWLLEMEYRGYLDIMDSFIHPFYQGGFDLMTDQRLVSNDIHRGNYTKIILPE